MKYIQNDVASFHCIEDILPSLERLFEIIRQHPSCLEPFRGMNEKQKTTFSEGGLQFYPTVKKTTLLYEPASDCFFKILHPLNIKSKALFLLKNRAKSVHRISEQLNSNGINTMKFVAYGCLKKGRRPFFVAKRVEGESLHEILIKGKRTLSRDIYEKVIGIVAKLHGLGYWLGDAQLAHIFVKNGEVSGLIDIDGIRKNRPFLLKNLAKDIAGFNHPELPLTEDEKTSLFHCYVKAMGIKNSGKFLCMVRHYTRRRWK